MEVGKGEGKCGRRGGEGKEQGRGNRGKRGLGEREDKREKG